MKVKSLRMDPELIKKMENVRVVMIDPQLTIGRINFLSTKIHEVFFQLEKLDVEVRSRRFWLSKAPLSLDEFEREEKEFFTIVANDITADTIVMIRLVNTSLERAIRLAHFLKAKQPDAPIVYGGSAATLLANQGPALNPLYLAPVAVLVVGEADITFPEYVSEVIRIRFHRLMGLPMKIKIVPGVRSLHWPFIPRSYLRLDNLSPLNFDLLRKSVGNYPVCSPNRLKVEIAASRGCPRKCRFCEMSAMHRCQTKNGHGVYRLQEANSTIENLNHLYNCGVRKIHFGDLIFPWQKRWVNSLKAAEIVNKFDEVSIYTSIDRFIQEEYLEQLASLGVTKISTGVETVTDRLRKWAGKPTVPLKALEFALEKAKALDIDVRLTWIIGFPGETLSEVKASISQAITWFETGLMKEYDCHNFHPRLDQVGKGEYSHLGKEYILQNGKYDLPTTVLLEAMQKYSFWWKLGYWPEHFAQQIAQLQIAPPSIRYGSSKITIRELVDLTRTLIEKTQKRRTTPWD